MRKTKFIFILIFQLILIQKTKAQGCLPGTMNNDYWVLNFCTSEGTFFDELSFKGNSVFSFPELKVGDDVFLNISLILPDADKNPYYVIQLYFIDDATDEKASLFKGVPFVKLKISATQEDSFTNYLPAFYAYKTAIKYNDIPLRATLYYFRLSPSTLQNMISYYKKSSNLSQIVIELMYGNKPTENIYRQNAFGGPEIYDMLNRIWQVKYTRK